MKKTRLILRTEARLGEPLEKILPEAYEKYGSLDAAGNALGISPATLYVWLLRLGYTKKVTLVKE